MPSSAGKESDRVCLNAIRTEMIQLLPTPQSVRAQSDRVCQDQADESGRSRTVNRDCGTSSYTPGTRLGTLGCSGSCATPGSTAPTRRRPPRWTMWNYLPARGGRGRRGEDVTETRLYLAQFRRAMDRLPKTSRASLMAVCARVSAYREWHRRWTSAEGTVMSRLRAAGWRWSTILDTLPVPLVQAANRHRDFPIEQ